MIFSDEVKKKQFLTLLFNSLGSSRKFRCRERQACRVMNWIKYREYSGKHFQNPFNLIYNFTYDIQILLWKLSCCILFKFFSAAINLIPNISLETQLFWFHPSSGHTFKHNGEHTFCIPPRSYPRKNAKTASSYDIQRLKGLKKWDLAMIYTFFGSCAYSWHHKNKFLYLILWSL